jgi:hypothetical protein
LGKLLFNVCWGEDGGKAEGYSLVNQVYRSRFKCNIFEDSKKRRKEEREGRKESEWLEHSGTGRVTD